MLTPRLPPDVQRLVLDFPMGLMALSLPLEERRVLVVKGTKEMLLAARLREEVKVYVVTFRSGDDVTAGLATAFFDDEDAPLFIGSPLIAEDGCEDLRRTLLEPEIDIHLFDEHGRELLGYRATVTMPKATRELLATVKFFPATTGLIRSMWDGLPRFMELRTVDDDAAAITVSLSQPAYPEDIFVMELRPEKNSFHGGSAVRHTTLVRAEPGQLQEWDIIDLLQRTFEASAIFHGPLKTTDDEEIADVLVVTATHILVVQAKDSPNTEAIANNKLSRKRATALKNLSKGLAQVRGAVRYIRSAPQLSMKCGGQNLIVQTEAKELFTLVVSKELFSDQYAEYTKMIASTWSETGAPCVALDYMELSQFTAHVTDEAEFFEVLNGIHTMGQEKGQYPRPRFGLGPLADSSA